ncbi:hypothetical protein GUITHDRAFT_154825, partial [Guillardia theta CCMP2712]
MARGIAIAAGPAAGARPPPGGHCRTVSFGVKGLGGEPRGRPASEPGASQTQDSVTESRSPPPRPCLSHSYASLKPTVRYSSSKGNK